LNKRSGGSEGRSGCCVEKNFYTCRVLTPDSPGYSALRLVPAPTGLSRSRTGGNKNTKTMRERKNERKTQLKIEIDLERA